MTLLDKPTTDGTDLPDTPLGHFLMRIDGVGVDTDARFDIASPSTEEIVATVARGGVEHLDAAVDAARRSFESGVWSQLPQADRAAIMRRIGERLNEDLDDFVEWEIAANGATVRQATGFHVGYAAIHWDYFAELAGSYTFEEAGPTAKWPTLAQSYLRREPIGVVGAITPWNFPLLLSMWKFGPALAAGNSVVVKPDEHTPLTMIRFAELAEECGLPPGVLNVVTGQGETVGAALAAHPEIDKIAFTGSTPVGRAIGRAAADTVKRVTLELGGKNPVLVLDDADLDVTVDGVLFGGLLYSGQICLSGSRLLVADAVHDAFVDRLVARARQIVLGDPEDFDTDMGPVLSGEQHARILGFIETGRRQGATIALGGGVPRGEGFERGWWVEPTIFTDVDPSMTIYREEIFGPVLTVTRFRDDDEAVAMANDSEYGLTAAVWTTDKERALDVSRRIQSGTVWINDHHMINYEVPFGGYKQSGNGRELGPSCLDAYTESKHIHLDLSEDIEKRAWSALLSQPADVADSPPTTDDQGAPR